MDQRAEYLIQVLEKIGSPLMAAVTAKISDEGGKESAQNMAALLTRTVQTSIDMASATELFTADTQDDSLRVALTALASPLVAGVFERNGKMPEEADLKKIITSLQAVLSFSENFVPNQENTARMNALSAQGQTVDVHQMNIQYIQALTPIINVSAAFSFGQSEQKLVMEITSKLVAKASAIRISLFGNLSEDVQKKTDLALLRTLAEIYTACHEAETARLLTMSDEDRSKQPQAPSGGLTLDNVWKAFDLRVAMLEALAENALPAANGSGKAPASMELPPVTEPDEPPSNSVPPAPVTQTPKASPPAGANPMSMFAVPKNKTEAPNAPPPPAEKTEPPPEKSSAKDEKNAPAQNNPQGNPMSFFTEKPKNDDESS